MRRNSIWLLVGVVVVAGAAGCYVAPAVGQGTGTPPATAPAPASATPFVSATRAWTVISPSPIAPSGAEEKVMETGVPIPTPFDPYVLGAVTRARADLARRLNVASDDVVLLDAQAVVWPDGGLGCPQPGMEYTQVLVEGLLIRFTVAGRVYEYHSGGARPPFLCE